MDALSPHSLKRATRAMDPSCSVLTYVTLSACNDLSLQSLAFKIQPFSQLHPALWSHLRLKRLQYLAHEALEYLLLFRLAEARKLTLNLHTTSVI